MSSFRGALMAVLVAAACTAPIPPLTPSPTPAPSATPTSPSPDPAPRTTSTAVPTPLVSPTPPAESPSPSPRSGFPEARSRLAGVTIAGAEDRPLPLCDESAEPLLEPPHEAQPAASGPISLNVVGQEGGRPHAVAYDGNVLYVGVGPRVVAFETKPSWRQVARSALLPGIVKGVAVQDGLVVAALGEAGIAVLEARAGDVALIGSLDLPGDAQAVALGGRIARVAAGMAGLQIVDLAVPDRPRTLGNALAGYDVLGVAVGAGSVTLAAAGADGLVVVDLSDAAAPVAVASLASGGHALGVTGAGTTAYVADGWGGLRIVDVSDASQPRLRGTLPTAGWAWQIALTDHVAYVAAGSQGLIVADVSDPEAPMALGSAALAGRQATAVGGIDGVAFVIDPFEGVQIVDTSAPTSPQPIGTWQPLLEAWAVAYLDERAYVAAGRAGLRALDLADPAQPRELDGLPTVAMTNLVSASAGGVLLSTMADPASDETYSLIDVDVADATQMRPRSAYGQLGRFGSTTFPAEEFIHGQDRVVAPSGPATGMANSGSVSVYANEWGILLVETGAREPCELAFLQTWPGASPGEATAASVSGDVAFVGAGGGFEVLALDISDARNPQVISATRASVGKGALVNGRWLYTVGYGVDDEGAFLDVLDVADPARPRRVGSLRLPAEPSYFSGQTMAFAAGRLFIAAYEAGVVAVDVSRAARPRLAGHLAVPGNALSVSAAGDYLYVGSDEAGLLVVDVDAGAEPAPEGLGQAPGWSGMAAAVDRPAALIAPDQPVVQPVGCTVTSTADGGPGTLRACLDTAKRGTAVVFDAAVFPVDEPATIRLRSDLTLAAGGITIDGAGGVVLDGGGEVESAIELTHRDGVTLRGLHIRGFLSGLYVDSDGNTIEDNVIAGNEIDLSLARASGNRIVGNHISVDAAGKALSYDPQAGGPGFDIGIGSAMNHIADNVIGGGVYVADPGSHNNTIVGNRIGVDVAGRSLPCNFCQLVLDEPFNRAGGPLPGEANVIGGVPGWIIARPGNVVFENVLINRR